MLEHIQARTKKPIFDTWFRNLELVGVEQDVVRIGTPNQFVKKWIEDSELMHTLCDAVREGFERNLTPELLITRRDEDASSDEETPLSPATQAAEQPQAPAIAPAPPAMLEQDSSIQLKD